MTTGYQMNFTHDPLGVRSFPLQPYTTNGTISPNSDVLDARATSAASSLLMYGKGAPDYGERIQENLLHLLEHFSSPKEPVRPIGGQLWCDTSTTPSRMALYQPNYHGISADSTPGHGVAWFNIPNPTDAARRAKILTRLVAGFRVRIHSTSGATEEYLIATSAAINASDSTKLTFQVTPAPSASRVGWFVGDWDYVLQSSTSLDANLNANGYTITNVRDPESPHEVATAGWVELAVSGAISNLNNLSDVNIASVSTNDILRYDGTKWTNTSIGSICLPITGGTMVGAINMGRNGITNMPQYPGYPANDYDVATKKYVDMVAAGGGSGGGPTILSLNDMTDVNIANPTFNQFLRYSGTRWTNVNPADTPFVLKVGGTITGNLTLAGPGHANSPGLAATETFVTNSVDDLRTEMQVLTAIAISELPQVDYVISGGYNQSTTVLTLQRLSGDLIPISIGLTPSGNVNHIVRDPNTSDNFNKNLVFESYGYVNDGYPNIPLADLLEGLNATVGTMLSPTKRIVFTSNGESTIYLGDTAVSQANQMNPTGSLGIENLQYTVGYNNLDVYVNGIKQYASPPGFIRISSGGSPRFGLHKGTHTGLSEGEFTGSPSIWNPMTYDFQISVNGNPFATVTLPGVLTMGELVDAINEFADDMYWDGESSPSTPSYKFGCDIIDGNLVFFSGDPGTGSEIQILDGVTNPLFANIVGNPNTTGAFSLNIGSGIDANYAPVDLDYKEIGRFGANSTQIEFTTVPANGARVELIIRPR